MERREFLEALRTHLQSDMNEVAIQKHIQYYDHYIRSGGGRGASEEEVIKELGDPRLIAKTILDVDGSPISQGATYSYQEEEEPSSRRDSRKAYGFDSLFRIKWYHKLWILLALILVVAFLTVVVFSVVVSVITFILPIVVFFLLIKIAIGLFKKK